MNDLGDGYQSWHAFSTVLAWKEESELVEQITFGDVQILEMRISRSDDTVITRSQVVGPEFFDLLGIEPILGRTFRPEDFAGDALRTTVVSRSGWQRLFNGAARLAKDEARRMCPMA